MSKTYLNRSQLDNIRNGLLRGENGRNDWAQSRLDPNRPLDPKLGQSITRQHTFASSLLQKAVGKDKNHLHLLSL